MKNLTLILALLLIGIFSCTSSKKSTIEKDTNQVSQTKQDTIVKQDSTEVQSDKLFTFKKKTPEIKPFHERRHKNALDSLKILQPELTTTVRRAKMGEKISLIRAGDSLLIQQDTLFQPEKFSTGWVNPYGRDFSRMWKYSDGDKYTLLHESFPETEFYAVLEFDRVYEPCSDLPAARSYYIKVPKDVLKNAIGGNIAVVYEYYECEPIEDSRENDYTTWVMWISDIPFD